MGQGVMRALWEKFNDDADGITIYICRVCGDRAVVNQAKNIYKCKNCGDNADIAAVPSSWCANLFFNEAAAMNIKMKFKLSSHTY